MAIANMFNPSDHHHHHHHCPPMSPRISFSSDFGDGHHPIKIERPSAPTEASSDFEFNVSGYNMMAADELFFKGRLLPYKVDSSTSRGRRHKTTTLRDELRCDDDDVDEGDVDESSVSASAVKPPKGSKRWKGLLGLKKGSHLGGHKRSNDKVEVVMDDASASQEMVNGGGMRLRDVEIGI
ncbi:hypothetical protein QJS10_CPB19g01740 [Acorus calamus]|uniref:Uncharacterized protein n=1 Tax=Acorus calamus TaxID=4465 RepID=A0AAV9CDI4_ACOCL|nr:hypothetical protein QJS10_CPB19g01740 [Acorus calamus]